MVAISNWTLSADIAMKLYYIVEYCDPKAN